MPQQQNEPSRDPISLVEEATFDFTLGDNDEALRKLRRAVDEAPECFEAWHALTEVHASLEDYDQALEAATRAFELKPEDIHINTSLSRIWMHTGDKKMAEHFAAKARTLGWKDELNSDGEDPGLA
ncbi:MAG: tetratricopeptide repeat protein [Puniceicoccales bacterium]